MHTEGSIIFSNPEIYDNKFRRTESWRWREAVYLLNPNNSESCNSQLLKLLDPIESDDQKYVYPLDIIDLVNRYINDEQSISELAPAISTAHVGLNFSVEGLNRQILNKKLTIGTIEGYLLANLDVTADISTEVNELISETLAYFEADEEKRQKLNEVFLSLGNRIVPHPVNLWVHSGVGKSPNA